MSGAGSEPRVRGTEAGMGCFQLEAKAPFLYTELPGPQSTFLCITHLVLPTTLERKDKCHIIQSKKQKLREVKNFPKATQLGRVQAGT